MLTEQALNVAVMDLWHYGIAYFHDLPPAVQLATLVGEGAVLASAGSLWTVTVPRDLRPAIATGGCTPHTLDGCEQTAGTP